MNKLPPLKPGDVFCTMAATNVISRMIRSVTKFWAKDNDSQYAHAGIITDPSGVTLEALPKGLIPGHLGAYRGQNVVIGRWVGMCEPAYWHGIDAIKGDIGQLYPVWRIPLFLIPGAAKWVSTGKFPVCSEWACKFLLKSGLRQIGRWQGWTPDDLADAIKNWKEFEVICEGKV